MAVNSSVTMRLAAHSARARLHARPARPAAVAVAAQLGRPQQLGRSSLAVDPIPGSQRRRVGRRGAVKVSAMVNVDISPSVVLGVGLIGAGVSLWQIRTCAADPCLLPAAPACAASAQQPATWPLA